MEHEREQWGSRMGFILAAVGSAIGLGNIWRFSYLCYKNGGGAFLIPYIVALLTTGIPVLILEYGLGHKMRGSAPHSLGKVDKRWSFFGWWPIVFVMFGIVLYYCVIISWCVNYFKLSFTLGWGDDSNSFFFKQFLQTTKEPFHVGRIRLPALIGLAIVWAANWIICVRGIEKGIERACKILIPLLVLLTGALVIRSLMLPGAMEGVKQYLKPDWAKLMQPEVWRDAYSQIFFTLSIGFGIMIAYASYLPKDADVTGNAIITAFMNCGYSLFAGFAVFGTLGFMAQQQGVPMDKVVTKEIGLAFVAYPEAISKMPGFPRLFGALFFLTLVVAGLSSSISIIEAFTTGLMDKFRTRRGSAVTVLCILGFLGGIIFTTQGGLWWADIVDRFLNQYGLVVVGLSECIILGWVYGSWKMREHINKTSRVKLGIWWDTCIRVVTPVVLVVLIVSSLVSLIQKSYGGYPLPQVLAIGGGWVFMTLLVADIFFLHGSGQDTDKVEA